MTDTDICVCGCNYDQHRWYDPERGEESDATPCGVCMWDDDVLHGRAVPCDRWRPLPASVAEQVQHRLHDAAELDSDTVRRGLAAWRAGEVSV